MLDQKELIKAFLTRNGPSLPVEIGKELGYNSFLTKAVLSELISKGIIKQSRRPIGNSLLYYLPGQEALLRKRLFEDLSLPERRCLSHLREEGPLRESELSPQERFIISRLYDFVDVSLVNGQKVYSLKGVSAPAPKPIPSLPAPAPAPPKPIETTLFHHKEPEKGFDAEVLAYLKQFGEVSVKKVIRRDRETNYVLKTKEPFPQVFFVKSKNKKRINESDLSLIYTETLQEKKPGLLVTKGDLTATAKKWMKDNVGDLIKLIRLK